MTKSTKTAYESDIQLGERYRDEQTGFEGIATNIGFFQYACERVCLESYVPSEGRIVQEAFDAPRLTHIATGLRAQVTKTGGPQQIPGRARSLSR